VVQWFKTMTTNAYIRGVKQHGWPRFDGKLWQRNYWEHIVRNGNELYRIRRYIIDNPTKWQGDRNHPTSNYGTIRELPPRYGNEIWMI
jgi:REP element-mobilizing transposase RayT